MSYAQNREDVILAGFFENVEKGFYVDVGANDPEIDSVTKYFYERGWSGINCEPQLVHFESLQKTRKRDINLNIGIGAKEGKLTLRQYKGDGLSTLSQDTKDEYIGIPDDNTSVYVDVLVKVKTLANIFRDYKVTTIQFMKVDVEGFEYEVLLSNDWAKYRPQVICIESNHIRKDWHALLDKNDYKLVFFDGLNEYFADSRNPEIEEKFSYVQSVVLGKSIAPRALAQVVYEQNQVIEKLSTNDKTNLKIINHQEDELAGANTRVLYLQNELDEISSLRAHIKKFARKKLHSVNDKIERTLQPQVTFRPIVPSKSDDLLGAAKEADAKNLHAYNKTFVENKPISLYRNAKHLVKHIIHGKKAGS